MAMRWNDLLVDQLDWHWTSQLRPRLSGLSDEEYLWEPTPGCWNIRRADSPGTDQLWGTGAFRMEQAEGEPQPTPVTTISWRIAHLVVEVFGERIHSHFGGPDVRLRSFEFSGTATGALTQLDSMYSQWTDGVRSLGDNGLVRPCGPAEGPFADAPLAALVLHINREVLHHGAEIALLRDLFRARPR